MKKENFCFECSYESASNELIASMFSCVKGDYQLCFLLENPNKYRHRYFDGGLFEVAYFRTIAEKNGVKKFFSDSVSLASSGNFLIVYDGSNKCIERYSFLYDRYITSGIRRREIGLINQFDACCIEKIDDDSLQCMNNYKIDKDGLDKATSAMSFKGFCNNGHCYSIVIKKIDGQVNLEYSDYCYEGFKNVLVDHKSFTIEKILDGYISSDEICDIIGVLCESFKDNEFVRVVIEELYVFADRIDIRNGAKSSGFDLLSPDNFINKSLNDVLLFIEENVDGLFGAAEKRNIEYRHGFDNGVQRRRIINN